LPKIAPCTPSDLAVIRFLLYITEELMVVKLQIADSNGRAIADSAVAFEEF
jgi:hypothetical protein